MESKNAPSIHRTFSARLDRIYTPDGKQRFGKGMLRVALPERELQFDARARGSLELPRSLKIAYPFDSIYNVDVDGRLVSFDLHTPQGLQEILLTIDSATEAEQLVALLPNTRTPDYAELRIQEQSFANALFRATPRTRITQLLIGLNVLAYLFCIVRGVHWLNPTPDQLMHMGANYWPLSTTTQWWRNFTCMFLHFGLIHIGFNMWVLAGAGQIVERLYGRRFFLMGYLYAGIIGSLVSMWFEHVAVSAGASGAVFGVFGMLIAYLIRQRGSIPPLVLKPMLKNALVFVGFNVLFGLSQTGIDNGAHFGGFGGGLLIGMFLSRPLHLPSRHALLTRRLLMAGIIAIASITSIVVAMPKARPGLHQEAQLKTLLQIQENEEAKLHEQFQSGAVLLNQKKIAPAQLSQLITETILPRYELLKQSVDQVEHVPGSRAEVVQQAMRHYYDARIDQFSFDVQLLSEEESAEKPDPDQTRLRRDTLNQKVESAMQELRGAANGLAQP